MGGVVEIMLTTPTLFYSPFDFFFYFPYKSINRVPLFLSLSHLCYPNKSVSIFILYLLFFDSSIWFSCLLPNRPFNLYLKWNRESPVFFFFLSFPCFWWKKSVDFYSSFHSLESEFDCGFVSIRWITESFSLTRTIEFSKTLKASFFICLLKKAKKLLTWSPLYWLRLVFCKFQFCWWILGAMEPPFYLLIPFLRIQDPSWLRDSLMNLTRLMMLMDSVLFPLLQTCLV